MKVTHLALKNWRNFSSVELPLQDRAFFVGPNASGKSNLLDVFRFLRDLSKPGGGLQKAIKDRGGVKKIRCLAARRNSDVEIEISLQEPGNRPVEWKYAIGINQETSGRHLLKVKYERVWKNGDKILNRPDEEDKVDGFRLTQTHLEQIIANRDFRAIATFFEKVSYLHLIPQLLKYPAIFGAEASDEDPFGVQFLEKIAQTTEKRRQSRLEKIENALRFAVPELKDLTHTRDEQGVPHLEAVYAHWRPKGAKQREDQFSDGTLRLLGLLWSLLDDDSLLLLEEPELSLHTSIVSKLAPLIYRIQRKKKRQVFLSTHSYELLSDKGISPDEVVLLKPDGEKGTAVTTAGSSEQIKALLEGGMSPGEAVIPRTAPKKIQDLEQLTFDFA